MTYREFYDPLADYIKTLDATAAERDTWRALADDLYAELFAARQDVRHWAGYASDHFKEKWHLDADLARIEAMLARYRETRQQ